MTQLTRRIADEAQTENDIEVDLDFIAGLLLLAVILLPYAWLVISSITETSELTAVPPCWIPKRPTLQKYRDMFTPDVLGVSETAAMFKYAMANSAVVSFFVTVVTLIVASLAAYAFARLEFRGGREQMLLGIVAVKMLPAISTMVALYVLLSKVQLLDTRTGLVLVYLSFTLPFAIWIMAGFFPDDSQGTGGSGTYRRHLAFGCPFPRYPSALSTRLGFYGNIRVHDVVGRVLLSAHIHQHVRSEDCTSCDH